METRQTRIARWGQARKRREGAGIRVNAPTTAGSLYAGADYERSVFIDANRSPAPRTGDQGQPSVEAAQTRAFHTKNLLLLLSRKRERERETCLS